MEHKLSRRERQALDILFRRGEITVNDLMEEIPDIPSYSAARAILNVLVSKELAQVSKQPGKRSHTYKPATSPKSASKSALKRVIGTFFDGSPSKLAANLLDPKDVELDADEIRQLRDLLDAHDQARKEK